MAKIFERKSTTLTISEFYDNFLLNKYRFDIPYQRKSGVWSEDKKSFLIDSILKNYPVPAIFLRPSVDNDTGKTIYDVVDGKQRLEAIIDFIQNRISLTTYFAEDEFIDSANQLAASEIAGLTFDEIKKNNKEFPDYIRQFWTYSMNVEYLYEQNEELVASVFDRLNRNGEPLTRQELRNAKYANSELLEVVTELTCCGFWKDKLSRLKSVRMEDVEFISELFFVILEENILDSSQDIIDKMYEKYHDDHERIQVAKTEFLQIVDYIERMNFDFAGSKRIYGITHLYSLFTFAWKMRKIGVKPEAAGKLINTFYSTYFSHSSSKNEFLLKYKDASSSRTRSSIQRAKRLEAMISYCENT